MKYNQIEADVYIIRLDPGDAIVELVEQFCRDHNIQNATVTGIGSVEGLVLAHYRIDRQKFSERSMDGIFEIASLQGNVSLFEGQPLAHFHVVVSDESMQAFAGHLVRGTCSATAELILQRLSSSFTKRSNPKIGLKIWDFPPSESA